MTPTQFNHYSAIIERIAHGVHRRFHYVAYEDLMQEGMVALLGISRTPSHRTDSHMEAYVVLKCKGAMQDAARKQRKYYGLLDSRIEDFNFTLHDTLSELITERLMVDEILKIIGTHCPAHYYKLFRQHYFEGKTKREIANMLGCSESLIGDTLKRGIRIVQRIVLNVALPPIRPTRKKLRLRNYTVGNTDELPIPRAD